MRVGGRIGARVRARAWIVVAAGAAASCIGTAQASDGTRIIYSEPLPALAARSGLASQKPGDGNQRLEFQAFGRQFTLSLTPNTRLSEQLKAAQADSSVNLYRGGVEGVEKSWVRLAAKGDELDGMIWDGADLYVIDSSAGTIIFKLADVVIEQGAPACASSSSPLANDQQKGDAAFHSLLGELKNAPAIMQAANATRRLTISALADTLFLQRYASEAEARDAIAIRLNNVDGIFSAQLSVEIRIGALFANDATSAAVSSATSPNTLLRDLARQRRQSPQLSSYGLTHLFTGRDLDGTTVGIAYIGALCNSEYSAGLTELRNTWLDSLVTAHEIGHTFGADHDGDSAGTCASTPSSGYLMGAIVSGSNDFSQCSLERMQATMQTSICLAYLAPANMAVAQNLGTLQRAVSSLFQWQLQVQNVGGLAAQNVRADINVPAALTIEDAVVSGGTCTSGAGVVQCQLGSIAGDMTRTITVDLRSETVGSHTIAAQVVADNDFEGSDNAGVGIVRIGPEADLALTLQGPASTAASESFNLDVRIVNQAPTRADGVELLVQLPSGVSARSASLANGTCTIEGSSVRCTLATLEAGATATGILSLSAALPGGVTLRATLSGEYVDPNAANDLADFKLDVTGATVQTAPASQPASSGGGGGGALGLLPLLGLLGFIRPARRRRSACTSA
jgi:hypothetical protein